MSHPTLDQLVALRERGLEPGSVAVRDHLAGCPACQAEATRLDQRVARIKALPSLRPARDRWPEVRRRLEAERSSRRRRWVASVGLAAAAALAGVLVADRPAQGPTPTELQISEAKTRSSQLEQLIQSYDPDARVTDGRTVRLAGELEHRIAQVDRQLEEAQMLGVRQRDQALLQLWRQRIGLLDALVDVHLTRASSVGF